MESSWLVLLAVTAFLMGYVYGKQAGIKKGYKAGCAETPIVLRQLSLEKGVCCLCRQEVSNFRIEFNSAKHIGEYYKE